MSSHVNISGPARDVHSLSCLLGNKSSIMPGNRFWRPHNYEKPVVGFPSPWPVVESLVACCAAFTSFWPHAEVRKLKGRSHRQTANCQVLHLDLGLNSLPPPSCLQPLQQPEEIERLLAVQP